MKPGKKLRQTVRGFGDGWHGRRMWNCWAQSADFTGGGFLKFFAAPGEECDGGKRLFSLLSLSRLQDELCHVLRMIIMSLMIFIYFVDVLNFANNKIWKVLCTLPTTRNILAFTSLFDQGCLPSHQFQPTHLGLLGKARGHCRRPRDWNPRPSASQLEVLTIKSTHLFGIKGML